MNPKPAENSHQQASPSCPFCRSTRTELISLFGQTLMGSQYYCQTCHSVFEAVRWTAKYDDEAFDDEA